MQAYQRQHPEKAAAWNAANREKRAAWFDRWRRNNLEASARHANLRRARKRNATGSYTLEEWRALCGFYEQTCLRCLRTDRPLTPDHIVPLAWGGSDDIDNIQPLCQPCNSAKGARSAEDYRQPQSRMLSL